MVTAVLYQSFHEYMQNCQHSYAAPYRLHLGTQAATVKINKSKNGMRSNILSEKELIF